MVDGAQDNMYIPCIFIMEIYFLANFDDVHCSSRAPTPKEKSVLT